MVQVILKIGLEKPIYNANLSQWMREASQRDPWGKIQVLLKEGLQRDSTSLNPESGQPDGAGNTQPLHQYCVRMLVLFGYHIKPQA